jgi:sugar phosphate isomerase/epimerase
MYDNVAPDDRPKTRRRAHSGCWGMMLRVALQLYTVRELAAKDSLGTLDLVRDAGYDGVEFAGLYGVAAGAIREHCDRAGLGIAGAHVPLTRFEADPGAVAVELQALGTSVLVFPSGPPMTTMSELSTSIARLGNAANVARDLGLRPVFHNHAREFEPVPGGDRPWDALVALSGLDLELDLGWAWAAGEDPVALIERHAGRVPIVHVKDMIRVGEDVHDCPVGDGEVGYERVLPAIVAAGVEWLIVEQDEPGLNPLDSIRRSHRAVREIVDVG